MNPPALCPSCLTELPDTYPYDHVAIDRALNGDRALFASMTDTEKREVVLLGLARNLSLLDLRDRLNWAYNLLQNLLPDSHPHSAAAERSRLEAQIRELWQQGLLDVTIAARTGWNPSKIGRTRKRLGLPTLPVTGRKPLPVTA